MAEIVEEYTGIVEDEVLAAIYKKASKLYKKRVVHMNSTFLGGGVAEVLSRLVPFKNEVGLDTNWRIIHGNPAFFDITKNFHNALQSGEIDLTQRKKEIYLKVNSEFAGYTRLGNYDSVIVHDPQPLPLIKYYTKHQPWIWRCHVDLSSPNKDLWNFLKPLMLRYDTIIVSSEKFKKDSLPVEQRVIHPAIDPLSLKNRDMSDGEIKEFIEEANVPTDKPVITQVSRMDVWKDPEGVLEVYNRVREKVDCRLMYCYNVATDDPEGMKIFDKIHEKVGKLKETGDVIFVLGNNDMLVNAVQRFSDVILQKSIKEGFGLTVAEALWKGKPVVASNVGGIPTQIKDGENGFLVDPENYDECAEKVIHLLEDKKFADEMGRKAKEHVRNHFLITRLMSDYLDLINDLINQGR